VPCCKSEHNASRPCRSRRDLNAQRRGHNGSLEQVIEKPITTCWQRNCSRSIIMVESTGLGIERYMSLLSTRQKLVAANIANADTPGYQTKDIDFQAELESQVGSLNPNVIEVQGLKTKNDGNNVNIDREAKLLAENALRFSIASNLAKSELSNIRMAIEEDKTS
jgi:flagellar basal-body rod protein FlgB